MKTLFTTKSKSPEGDPGSTSEAKARHSADASSILDSYVDSTEEEKRMRDLLGNAGAISMQPVRYESYRAAGMPWVIEHGLDGKDYVYQLLPQKPIRMAWQDVVSGLIAAMDSVFPRSTHIDYFPPKREHDVSFYTIRARDVVSQPGWSRACKKQALEALVNVNVWPKS